MEAIEFACVIDEITKSFKIEMDSEIAGKMFDIYEGSYDNYTLLQLIAMLRKAKYENTVPWNKKALIKMIEDKKLDIPKRYEDMEETIWDHYRIHKSIDVIQTLCMEFNDEGCIFQDPRGNIQELVLISQEIEGDYEADNYEIVYLMWFENMHTKTETCMYVEDFIWSLDNENVTIVQNPQYGKYLSNEEKERWTNYVRWI
jgi:hypothetical protein